MIEPATLDVGDAVKVGNVVGSEEGGQYISYQAADTVNGEDIEGIIDAKDEFELSGVVGERCTENAVDDSGPDRDITWNGSVGGQKFG